MKKLRNLLSVFGIFCVWALNVGGYHTGDYFAIDAEKNAFMHNNIGINYLKEGYYYGAIKEFNIAITLNPNTQATALYYNNLGKTYLAIGYPNLAQNSFERALTQNPMEFEYYQNLIESFKQQKILKAKYTQYSKKKTSACDNITLGLILIAMGDKTNGIIKLDTFVFEEPDLIITKAIRAYIKTLTR